MSNRRRPTAPRPKHRLACRPGTDMLEGRKLMAIVPYAPTVDLSNFNWQNVQIPTTPMTATPVRGVMPPLNVGNSTVFGDRFQFYLNKREVADISLEAYTLYQNIYGQGGLTENTVNTSTMSIYAMSNGVATYSLGGVSQPGLTDYVVDAPASGWYQASVHTPNLTASNIAGWYPYEAGYQAFVRPIALDPTSDSSLNPNKNPADAAKLNFAGGVLDAWMNGRTSTGANGAVTNTGNSVSFSGPTGRGFNIDGQWTESRNPTTGTVTYSGTNLKLEMADPLRPGVTDLIPLSIGNATGLVVTIAQDTPNDTQGLYGQVLGTQFSVANVPFASQNGSNSTITSVVSSLSKEFGMSANLSQYGVNVSAANNLNWGINLGPDASQQAYGLPTNAAVPYIWFEADGGSQVSASIGSISASVGSGVAFSAVIDPADPSYALAITGLPGVPDAGDGASINGLIPYTPIQTGKGSTPAVTPMFGDVFARGALDISALTEDTVPLGVKGDVTLNLDPNHLGVAKIATNLETSFYNLLTNKPISSTGINQLKNDLQQVSFGVNGTVSLSVSAGALSLSMPLASASAEWDGIHQKLGFAGGNVNPLAGTPLSFLTSSSTENISGSLGFANGGSFDVDLSGSFGFLKQTLAGANVEIASGIAAGTWSASVTGTTDIQIGFGTASTVGVWGDVQDTVNLYLNSNGYASLSASGSASASAALLNHTSGTGFENYSYGTHTILDISGLTSSDINGMLQGQVTDAENVLASLGNGILNYLESEYYSLQQKVQAAWNATENFLKSL